MKSCDINIRHAHVNADEQILDPLRLINPILKHIKLNKKKAEACLEVLVVLIKCHTQSKEFIIQLFKHSIIKKNCIRKACNAMHS